MMDIFNEMLWPQFQQLDRVRTLPLNEQVNAYNIYVNELRLQRMHYSQKMQSFNSQRGGKPRDGKPRYLLNEDGTYVLNEDGSKIEYYY